MKKILFTALMMATFSISYAQYELTFETAPAANEYTIGNNGPAATPKMIGSWEVNPEKSGINTSENCVKILEEASPKPWAYPIFEFGTGGTTIDASKGKFLKVKILSTTKTEFTMTLSPQIATVLTPITKTFTGITPNTWFEAVFDFSGEADGYVARMDYYFDKDGATYYIDDIKQVTTGTLSTKDVSITSVSVYPNPSNNTISISGNNEIKSISVFNVLGKRVLSSSSYKNIDISQLSNGLYILKTDKGATSKFIKQ